jgi:peptide/nickel transport system substrate-binding protein
MPFMTNFSLRFYENEQDAIDGFNAKEIDGLGGISPEEVEMLLVGHRLASISLPRYYAIFFNPNTHPALKEKEVRQALAASIDRAKITREIFNDYAATAEGPLAPQTEGYDAEAIQAGKGSAENAKKLLDSAGWLVNPEDGIRYKTIGRDRIKLEFTALVPDLPNLLGTMDIVKNEWTAIGVKASMTPIRVEDMQKGPIKTRNYEMIVFGNVLKGNPDVFAFWHSSQKFYPGLNLAMYENKAVDVILAGLQKAEIPDKAQLKKLQELIHTDAPAAFLMNPNYLYAIPQNLQGTPFENLISPEDRLRNTEKWYMRTRRQFLRSGGE